MKKKNTTKTTLSPYAHSTILQKLIQNKTLGKQLKIAFVDIDATLTGHLTVTKKAREKLEELDYAVVFVTARTEEMVMSKEAYEKSVNLGFTRPKPYLKKQQNKHYYIDPQKYNPNLVDPDIIIGSTGTQILIKQTQGGYLADESFEKQFGLSSRAWRKKVLQTLARLTPEKRRVHLAPIEFEENYKNHTIDIFPPKYRITLLFKNLEGKITFLEELAKRKTTGSFLSSLNYIDDSHPEKEEFIMYLTPQHASKRFGVEHVVNSIFTTLAQIQDLAALQNIQKSDMHVLLAGDSYPDLTMLLYGATGTKATALAVGGSRLTRVLTHESLHTYAGENISRHKKQLKRNAGKIGHYHMTSMLEKKTSYIRNIIFGDHAFPKTKGPETIIAYLSSLELV